MVSLVVPARPALSLMAERFKSGLNFEQLCEDKDITGAVLREIINQVSIIILNAHQIMIVIIVITRVSRADWRSSRSPEQ